MPKRTDLHKILVIGAGPIIIGQGCEFDYSGSQAVKALKEEGYEVVLVNSNPATIMTDPQLADATYVEPIEHDTLAAVIRKERPDALLPTLGGQTALNAALGLAKSGVLAEYGVELIGAQAEVIEKAESRELFREAMEKIGLKMPASGIARTIDEVRQLGNVLPFPLIVRPAFTLGGTGGGVAYNLADLEEVAGNGLAASPTSEVMIEQSVLGWKEIEMEVMRDVNDNCVIICSIENLDPMGVHTGDSITVAPVQTLSDAEYQQIRDASIAIMREIGVETGGSNVQFGVNPANGEIVVIEMNPRVSRSSALASKATGFPIAKIAAKLAVGYTLDELRNDITRETVASFEPAIDYCVVKIPRFTFEKFPGAKDELTTAMKSVGEAMSIGRTFKEAMQKGLRSMEIGATGLGFNFNAELPDREAILESLQRPNSRRIFALRQALLAGITEEEIFAVSAIDPWFVRQLQDIVSMEQRIRNFGLANDMTAGNEDLTVILREAKEYGFSDRQLAEMWKRPETDIRRLRKEMNILPTYYLVDTCAGEFEAYTPYFYSTYEKGDEINLEDRRKVLILGGGPNRIGQGIEFDYCCCHASFALRDAGVMAIMANSNPETVSTDYDTSDRLYFEPLTFEDVMNIVETEKPEGVIVQFGGQTPLNLAVPLMRAGVPILGTSPDAIDRAEDRERFQALIQKLGLLQPPNGTAMSLEDALAVAERIAYPVVVRPSYVLGGRAMAVAYDVSELTAYFHAQVPEKPKHPILIDKFLEHAVEVDVDAISDGKDVYVAGIMEHIEEAGIHSGDSACVLPSYSLSYDHVALIASQTEALARELKVIGLMNIQFAIKGDDIYILEVNPRASRTAPFVSKATGVPLPYLATQVMLGKSLDELDPWSMRKGGFICVKEAVMPFQRFPGVDVILGPEMHSTGEVMGMGSSFGEAFLKSQLGAGQVPPQGGKLFLSVNDRDKPFLPEVAEMFARLGFELLATKGTAAILREHGLKVEEVRKVYEGRPNIVDLLINHEVALVVNTASGKHTARDSKAIRQAALNYKVPYCTTIAAARATATAIGSRRDEIHVESLQEYYARDARG
ncbi:MULTISPECIES: carbamoyl-phosphate synthase large subunit [Desulfovibrio]|uniref:Carbamoyl phosphate synthase large chain n=3 Tax=Desulfovibrio TaxID=872 RepID=A0AA94HR31_DESDE|nr:MULTISPECIES: carbamoyl-phosphate synthase large subunit [Desulfovibrio]ATD81092.1 carbamoyl-phosphate synthase large subunit [Desulfovibrio sp. G11]MDY0203584.1 carbamoyl-phosphate synthase large subunit [Desulfovibrio desulfuricans]SFW24134.1 carbamoyl-phosphate synthase large subunit [Desulfovibrio desulfuricans]SPD36700.1 Carbamoyl-phosphate synthase (glutamine-hydrolysing), large subunit [Desulfovibrio sp. G11]